MFTIKLIELKILEVTDYIKNFKLPSLEKQL